MIDLVLLAGSVGHGRDWTHGHPRPLLPVPGSTLLENILQRAQSCVSGISTVCANGRTELIRTHLANHGRLAAMPDFFDDEIPRGTAGCLLDSRRSSSAQTFLIAGGAVWLDDDPHWLIEQHRQRGHALTVFCTHDSGFVGIESRNHLRPTGLYCCEREVLDYIRPAGFQDLKEQLVPTLQQAGLRVGAVRVRGTSCEVVDWPSYLRVLTNAAIGSRLELDCEETSPGVWRGLDCSISEDARLIGPCVIEPGAVIGDGATLVGPALVGQGSRIESAAQLIRAVVPPGAVVPARANICDRLALECAPPASPRMRPSQRQAHLPAGSAHRAPGVAPMTMLAIAGVTGLFLWSFAPTILSLYGILTTNPDYGAGLLVPLAALYMVSTRRQDLSRLRPRFWATGVLIGIVGMGINLVGDSLRYSFLENLGLLVCAIGLIMTLLGKLICRAIWFPLAFLFIMVPLPHTVHHALMYPLQGVVAGAAANFLEIAGVPAERYGHVLEVAGQRMAVAEACSGLRLALAFLLVTGVVAYVIDRPFWQKLIVMASSIPIALGCNVFRVAGSSYLYYAGMEWLAQGAFHDGAGLVMMPIALLLILIEFKLLANIIAPRDPCSAWSDAAVKPCTGIPAAAGQ